MLSRIIAIAAVLISMLCPAGAGIDETYVRSSELPSWSDTFKAMFGSVEFGKSYAVIIGVGDYDSYDRLSAPSSDAERVRDFLRDEAGFDYIVTLTDERASRARIETLMETTFPNLVRKNDRFLLYFSGHGATRTFMNNDKRGYLILKTSKREAWDEMIDMPRVMQWAENLQHVRHSLFLLDSCFSGLAAVQIKGSPRDQAISRLSRPAHQLVTAGVEDERSYSFRNESLFTKAFLEAARGTKRPSQTGVVSLSEIMVEINRSLDEVRAKSPGIKMSPHQYLTRAKDNPGDFFFLQKDWILGARDGKQAIESLTVEVATAKGDDRSEASSGKAAGSRTPSRVAIGPDTRFFDVATGRPLLWFVRTDADYEFFDGPGFHPRSGEKLGSFTRDESRKFEKQISEKEQAIRKERERLDRERADREARDAAAREALARKQAEDNKARETEAARASEAGRRCDELAANPNDRNKVGQGASFASLKAQAPEAVAACELAMKQKPSELRFQYQLARALQFSDRARAFSLHQGLIGRRYGASYDNIGWMYYSDKQNKPQAISSFRQGIQVGDVDSLVSLAELVDRGDVTPANNSETKIELCRRAAELGHIGARQCYEAELAKQEQAEKDRMQQLERQKMVIQIIGAVIQNVAKP